MPLKTQRADCGIIGALFEIVNSSPSAASREARRVSIVPHPGQL
jgi:hypothetical protein